MAKAEEEVISKLKELCYAREERYFNKLHHELEKMLNPKAKAWLDKQMENKSMWALAFDEGGSRYGIMTTNGAESLNNVFTAICALSILGIVMYSFEKMQ